MLWLLWAFLLMIQDAAFTLVSRACNSRSPAFHALAATISNSIWFASQFILIGIVYTEIHDVTTGLLFGAVYVASTVAGGTIMHVLSMRYLEGGKRCVGG